MSSIYVWVKNVVYFLLLVKIMEYIVPSEKSGKYIKLFSGILLIIILIQPFLKILNWDGRLNNSVIDISNKIDQEQVIKDQQKYLEFNDELSLEIYKKNITERIFYLLENEGYEPKVVQIELENSQGEYGNIKEVFITISKNSNKETNNSNEDKIVIEPIIIEDFITADEGKKKIDSNENILIEKNIKNVIINFYNLSSDNIHITID